MGMGGQYTIRIHGVLDDAQVRSQIAAIQREINTGMLGAGGKGKGKGAMGGAFVDTGKEAGNATKQVKRYGRELGVVGKQQKSFGSSTLDVTKKVVQFGAVTAVIRGVTSGMGDMVRQTFELDSALTEFKKVSDLSGKGLEEYTKQAYEAGRATAKTGVEMIDAATQFRKMGYGDAESLELANYATMFQNIADAEISAGDAAKFINSQMKAYSGEFSKYATEGEKAAKVIDTVNEVANKNAVGTNDLQLALTKTSAAMGGFGNSFDEVVGIMTAGTEIMVGMPSQVARGWRTIGANILEVAQKSDTYTAAAGKVNVATRDQNGEMKNTYAIMKDLYTGIDGVSASWKDLNDEEKSAIALELAGKNNMEKFRAVMDNFGTAIKATAEAQESQGSASRENAKFLDSMEGSLQNLKSAWSEFANAMVDSGTLKTMMNKLAEFIRFLSTDFGQALVKGSMYLAGFGLGLKLFTGIGASTARMFGTIGGSAMKLGTKLGIVSKKSAGIPKRLTTVRKGLKATRAPLVGAAKAADSASYALNPLGAAFLAVGAAAVITGVGIYKAYKSTHQYRDEVKDLSKANEESVEKIEANAKSAEFLTDKIEELSKVEDKTNAEKERMAAYVKRLNELMPGLNLEYDKEKDALNKTTDAIREYIKAKKEEAKIKAYQENFEKSLNEQIKLEEKRKDALKEYQRAKEQYDSAVQSGYVDKSTQEKYSKAKATLKDISQAYIEASKEVTKQNNNMLIASGDWDTMADKAKTAGLEVTESLVDGIESGRYLIPETMEGLEGLIKFDDLSKTLNLTGVGQSLVGALEQGMREGNISVDDALRIGEQMKDLTNYMSTQGRQSVQELSDAFAMGDIDFTEFSKGIKEALGTIDTVELSRLNEQMTEAGRSAGDVADRIREISQANPDASIQLHGVELAEEQVDTVLDYLDKVDGKDPEATVNVNGTEVAVKDIENLEELTKMLTGKDVKFDVKANTKKAQKDIKKTQKQAGKFDGKEYEATLSADNEGALDGIAEAKDGVNDYDGTEGEANLSSDPSDAEAGAEKATQSVRQFDGQQAIAFLQQVGAEATAIEINQAGDAILSMPDGKTITVEEIGAQMGTETVGELQGAISELTGKNVSVSAGVSGQSKINTLRSSINGIHSKTVTMTVEYKKVGSPPPGIDGKAKGTKFAKAGLAEVNEEGWEFIRDRKTGQLRIAAGGQRTVTVLNRGDTVYTHQQSKRMVAEGEVDIKIPQRARGQNNALTPAQKKQKAQESYNDAWERRKTAYEDSVATLEYRAKMANWSDEVLAKNIRAAYNRHIKLLKTWNNKNPNVKKWKADGAKVKTSFGVDPYRDMRLAGAEAAHDKIISNLDKTLSSLGLNKKNSFLSKAVANTKVKWLTQQRKAGKISLDEYNQYKEEIYRSYIEGMMKLHETGRKSFKSMKSDLDSYVKSGKITWAEYYEYLEDLIDNQVEHEEKALEKRKEKLANTRSLAMTWIDRQIEKLERENEETEEQNELIERQNDLEKARTQRMKVYRQGQGFIYEQDTQLIREATNALQEYKKEQDSPELKMWKDLKQLLEDIELDAEIRNLEVLSGGTFEKLFGSFGTDTAKWTEWLKENLATEYGLENLLEELGDKEDWRTLQSYLDANGNVKSAIVNNRIDRNRFATGTLSAPAGFARVAENGYEIALLGQGDAVMPHGVSENLMKWGAYSPTEFATAINSNDSGQVFNFDRLILPNVSNAESFIHELNNLPNRALQYSRGRA